uniref:Uncharacterized protein n=1 Tax=Arundo donax TaxID=35708 RepID=A0A0A9HI16_ARUDO
MPASCTASSSTPPPAAALGGASSGSAMPMSAKISGGSQRRCRSSASGA